MKYSVVTFGCRVNQADSLGFEEDLIARGAIAAPPEQADLVIVNTCSVTATADQGARQTIRRIARDNPLPDRRRLLCHRRPGEVGDLPNVVRAVPTTTSPGWATDRARCWSHDSHALRGRRRCLRRDHPAWQAGRTSFTLRVQTGCQPARIASSRRLVAGHEVWRLTQWSRKSIASRLPGSKRSHSLAHLGSMVAIGRPRRHSCSSWARWQAAEFGMFCFGSAHSNRWTAHGRSSISSLTAVASRHIFTCRCSTRAIACSH